MPILSLRLFLQDCNGQVQSSRIVADCDFRGMKSTLFAELQSALERDPDLLKTPASTELESTYSSRTQVSDEAEIMCKDEGECVVTSIAKL